MSADDTFALVADYCNQIIRRIDLRLRTAEEIDQAAKSTVAYRPPGQ